MRFPAVAVECTTVHTNDRDSAAEAVNRIAPHRPRIRFHDPGRIRLDLHSARYDGFSAHSVTLTGLRYSARVEPLPFLLAGVMLDAEATGTAADDLRFLAMAPVSEPMRRFWATTAEFIRDQLRHGTGLTPLVADHLLDMAASAVLAVFPNTTMTADRIPGRRDVASAAVRRAVAFADGHAHRPIGVSDLAASAGVDPYALREAFRRYLDTTPTAYLRRVRLDGAHRDLTRADPATGATVGAIARRWGFADTGRFARAYDAAYGRLPGETLHA